MTLVIRGNKEKIAKYRKKAEDGGLEIVLYSEEKIDVKGVELQRIGSEQLDKIFKLPWYLQRTARYLVELKEASATDISKTTKKARAMESKYLNELANLGFATKEKRGHTTYYKPS